ncbi:class I SAM-dependent RNA methyltransferase [Kribbia dieselivorans]|uniref:class I SAM-dependent RNA methyltransferase n=1 Tax=Kribbia dieselivorans TaxID=331526 RepID=UPI000837EE14|nr:TRAM domain-containing protein [Kribbia dieselivorans]
MTTQSAEPIDGLTVGDEVEVVVGAVAHGGHFVARHEGRVIFVRHTLPGERVRVRITDGGPGERFLRGDAVEVLEPSADRVSPPCAFSGPGMCGGCDFQHVDLARQRLLKADVVREQFERLAGIGDLGDLVVEPVEGSVPETLAGLRWRSRVEFAVGEDGRAGLRRHRSHAIVPIDDCVIADPRIIDTGVLGRTWAGEKAVDVIAPAVGETVVVPVPSGDPGPDVTETVAVAGREHAYAVAARGFWQVHTGAPNTFVDAVMAAAEARPGEKVIDLYSGAGLFSVPLAHAVGERGAVQGVESDRSAVEHAVANLAATPWAQAKRDRVDRWLNAAARTRRRADLVVLDPPRTGAKRAVLRDVVGLRPRRIVYVACDPAALARDAGYLREFGWSLTGLRALDAFPMTHHVECVAVFEPARG